MAVVVVVVVMALIMQFNMICITGAMFVHRYRRVVHAEMVMMVVDLVWAEIVRRYAATIERRRSKRIVGCFGEVSE